MREKRSNGGKPGKCRIALRVANITNGGGAEYNVWMPLQIHTIVSMPFQENTYIVWRDGRTDALVIDPGLEPDAIFAFLDDRHLQVAAILNTHGHADHIAGNEAMKERFPNAPLLIGVNETALLTDAELNMSAAFGFAITSPPAD